MQATLPFMMSAVLSGLVLGAIGLGGAVYETVVVDPAWPENPSIIRSDRGGINRARFWAPAHLLYPLVLCVSLWLVWSQIEARWWMVSAILVYFSSRAWSIMYFIPKALRFEELGGLAEEQRVEARRWTQLSRWRLIPSAFALAAQFAVVLLLASH